MKFKFLLSTALITTLVACGGAEERKAVYMENAKASIEAGDIDKARIELKNVLQIDPKDGDAYFQLGKIYEQQKEYRKAYNNYLKAEELKPDLLANQARLGRFYLLLLNDKDKTLEKIDLILFKEPANSDGLLLKAGVELKNKNTQEAIKITKDIVARDPGHIDSITFLATLHIKDKKVTEAISLLETSLKNNQNSEQLNKLLASALLANKDYERAEVIYKGFLERNPGSSTSYNNLAAFYNHTDDKIKAEQTLRASVDNDPGDVDRILTLVKYIREVKGSDDAINELKSFIASNIGIGKLRIALAELHALNGDKQSAVDVWKTAINDFSEEVTGITARTALASIYISDKEYDKASEVVEEAISISPNDPQVNFLRAKFAVINKDLEKAIIALRIVTKEMPENIEAYILLANVYQQEGNKEQVNSTLISAYENNKSNPDALLKLAEISLPRDIELSEKIIDQYNNIKESDYDGLAIKATILGRKQDLSGAYDIALTLMDKYPGKPAGYFHAIQPLVKQGDKQKAISTLEKGYLSAEDNRLLLFELTNLQVAEKQYDLVKKRIKAELVASPDDVQLKILLAKVYMVNNNADSAETLLNEALILDAKIEEPYLLLSQIYQSKRDKTAFIAILIEGEANVKASLKIPLKLAARYELDGEYNKAIDVYYNFNESKPGNLLIINNLAALLSNYADGKAGLKLASELIKKLEGTDQPAFLDTIGWVSYKLGDAEKAIENLKQAVDKNPNVNVFNYHLGMAYKLANDTAQAKIYLEKSLANKEDFVEKAAAEEALKNL